MNKKAFTLVEVMVGAIVIAIISTAGYVAASVLFRSHEMSFNRTQAVNLLQKSQEELLRVANNSSIYDILQTCQFPTTENDPNSCGLSVLLNPYSKFTRNAEISLVNSSSELKRALVTVAWTELGQAKSLQSIVLIPRPPDALPGNIIGKVFPVGHPTQPVSGASIKVVLRTGSFDKVAASSNTLVNDTNFNFAQNGNFILPEGDYDLTVTHPNYMNYTHPNAVAVNQRQETRVDIALEPKPENAELTVRVIDQTTGIVVNFWGNGSKVELWQRGNTFLSQNGPVEKFVIGFNNNDPQCFTVRTNDAFLSAFAGQPSCDLNHQGLTYEKEGWSSAQFPLNGSGALDCRTGVPGDAQADQKVCVNPGEKDRTIDARVKPVPTATIKGRIIDKNNLPINGAIIDAFWPVNTDQGARQWVRNGSAVIANSGNDGRFVFTAPAVREMFNFGGSNNDKLKLRIQAKVSIKVCCNQPSEPTITVEKLIGPISNGAVIDLGDIMITVSDLDCGNAQGVIRNDQSGAGVSSATVTVLGLNTDTVGGGSYLYSCPSAAQGFKIPVGSSSFKVVKNGFYSYSSTGNFQYNAAANINIIKNQTTNYDAKMWPQGFGNIHVTVHDKSTGGPIAGIKVVFRGYNAGVINKNTDAGGHADFDGVIETWPAAGLPASSYYNHTSQSHQIEVSDPSGAYFSKNVTVGTLNAGQTLPVNVDLEGQGGF